MAMTVWEKALAVAWGKDFEAVPVVLQVYGLVLKRFGGVKEYEYYQDVRLQLRSKVAFQRRFPSVVNIGMGSYPEGGEMITIPTAFGGEIRWMEDSPPYVVNYPIAVPEDVDRIEEAGVPDAASGVASEFLKRLEYFYEWFPKDLREEYGYVDGVLCPGALVEGAALSMGYDKFFVWMRLHPDSLHRWLRIATDWYLKYCRAIEEVVGPCKVLWVPDHIPHMMGKKQFQEFVLPYLNKVFGRYKGALRVWHNEGAVGHMLEEVDKIDAEVWHFGPSEDVARCRLKTHFCLQGNIHPPDFVKMSERQVVEECEKLISMAWPGKFWLSTGGGMSPGTPFRNIDAMVSVAKRYEKHSSFRTL